MLFRVNVPAGVELVVFGDIHAHPEQFEKLLDQVKPSEKTWLVSVGDLFDKGFGKEASYQILRKLKELSDRKIGFMVQGNHELKHLKKAKNLDNELEWIKNQPTAIVFTFQNGTKLTVLHGGVLPSHTWDDLEDINICYIRRVDIDGEHVPLIRKKVDGQEIMMFKHPGKIWGELYDGRFGYIISGHDAQKDGIPKFYNHCANIDTACYHTGKLTALYYSENGRGETITITGTPKHPETSAGYNSYAIWS